MYAENCIMFSIKNSMLPSVCYTVIYMVRVRVGLRLYANCASIIRSVCGELSTDTDSAACSCATMGEHDSQLIKHMYMYNDYYGMKFWWLQTK